MTISQMDGALFLKLAQQATKNPDLLAAHIDAVAQKQPRGWQSVATQLQIDDLRLAKLALCRRPAAQRFELEVRQIAGLLNVDPLLLRRFLTEPIPQPAAGVVKQKQVRSPAARAWSQPQRRLGWMAAGLVLTVLLLVSAFGFASARGSQATLLVQQGQATVFSGGVLSGWLASVESVVPAGQMRAVKSGDRIAVGAQAVAELRFFDGSSVALAENTQLVIQELSTSQTAYRVRVQQLGGVTLSRVLRLLGVGDIFEINTPSSTVSVRGTEFTVAVQAVDRTWIGVDKGVVHVVMDEQAVDVRPGQQVIAQVGQPLQVQPKNGEQPQVPQLAPPAGVPAGAPAGVPSGASPTGVPGTVNGQPTPGAAAPTSSAPDGQDDGDDGASQQPPPPDNASGSPSSVKNPKPPSDGAPQQVPGSPPQDNSGGGSPPDGGADPPGQDKEKKSSNEKVK